MSIKIHILTSWTFLNCTYLGWWSLLYCRRSEAHMYMSTHFESTWIFSKCPQGYTPRKVYMLTLVSVHIKIVCMLGARCTTGRWVPGQPFKPQVLMFDTPPQICKSLNIRMCRNGHCCIDVKCTRAHHECTCGWTIMYCSRVQWSTVHRR